MKITEILGLSEDENKQQEEAYVSIQQAYDKAKSLRIKFNKPFPVYFFAREDGKALASTDPFLKIQIAKEDNKAFIDTGKTVGVLLTKELIEEKTQLVNLFKRSEKGEIKFLQSLECQLICELFDQCGLTTISSEEKSDANISK